MKSRKRSVRILAECRPPFIDHGNCAMVCAQVGTTRAHPFKLTNCADLEDVPPKPTDLMSRVTSFYELVKAAGVCPLTAKGDHHTSLPELR